MRVLSLCVLSLSLLLACKPPSNVDTEASSLTSGGVGFNVPIKDSIVGKIQSRVEVKVTMWGGETKPQNSADGNDNKCNKFVGTKQANVASGGSSSNSSVGVSFDNFRCGDMAGSRDGYTIKTGTQLSAAELIIYAVVKDNQKRVELYKGTIQQAFTVSKEVTDLAITVTCAEAGRAEGLCGDDESVEVQGFSGDLKEVDAQIRVQVSISDTGGMSDSQKSQLTIQCLDQFNDIAAGQMQQDARCQGANYTNVCTVLHNAAQSASIRSSITSGNTQSVTKHFDLCKKGGFLVAN